MSDILKESDAQKYLRENGSTSVRNSAYWDWAENAKLLLDDPGTAVRAFGFEWLTLIAKDALLWDRERKKLANAVVQVIGTLDEIIEQVEEITLHDVNYFAVPAELWHELEDALEKMPERAESFLAAPQQAIPSEYVTVPIQLLKDITNCFDNVPTRAHVVENVDANLKRIAQWVNASDGGYGLYQKINEVLSAATQPESDGK